MRRALLCAAALLVVATTGCDFPDVPRSAKSGIKLGQRFEPFASPRNPPPGTWSEPAPREELEAQVALGRPQEVRGRVASNAVSNLVIQREDGGWVTVQVTPQTQLMIGNQVAGLREIQPGSEVRASFAPAGGGVDVGLRVEADPQAVGWGRSAPGNTRGAEP